MEKKHFFNILRSKGTVFSFKEILLASNETKPMLLKRRLNYYVQQGELYAIRRGLYAKDKNYNRLELATKILKPAYVSFETVLVEAGIVFQHYARVFVASYKTKDIVCDGKEYSFHKIKDAILTNNAGLENRGNYCVASKERAFLDVLYLHKDYHFDNLGQLDFDKVLSLLPIYNKKRMTKKVHDFIKAFKEDRAES